MQLAASCPFRDTLQPLAWSIGSLSGVLNESQENTLLISSIIDILKLVQMKTTKDDKAVVAACFMYIIQQYPRFLKNHFVFLKQAISKNFVFMHEKHPGVQDMACDTFKKIAKSCGGQLVIPQQVKEVTHPPFINDIIVNIPTYVEELSVQQRESFFEAVASIIRFERNHDRQCILVDNLMYRLNDSMHSIIKAGVADSTQFHTLPNLQTLRDIVRYARVVCSVIPNAFSKQVSARFPLTSSLFLISKTTATSTFFSHNPSQQPSQKKGRPPSATCRRTKRC